MRTLTIKRRKKFVGSLNKLKIYIEDLSSSEMVISGVPCRQLGELKNGETVSFQIGDGKAKLFIICDHLSKDICNELYVIPEGTEDIYLEGENKYDIFTANAFRIDNNDAPQVAENRKATKKRGVPVIVISIILGLLIGFVSVNGFNFSGKEKSKTFTADEMSITLTNQYTEVEIEGFTAAYDSKDIAVLVIAEDFSMFDGLNVESTMDYGTLLMESNGLDVNMLTESDDKLYFIHEANDPQTGNTYVYYSYIYKSENAFWLIQFATLKEKADTLSATIETYANSVSFSD